MSSEDVFVGAIDQGTSSSRFIIYDQSSKTIGCHHVEFTQFYPQAGWVEHDAMEILESVKVCVAKAVDKATADGFNVDKGLRAIGLTNQRETTLVWSKSTGRPLYNAIVWMDARTSSICRSSYDSLLNFYLINRCDAESICGEYALFKINFQLESIFQREYCQNRFRPVKSHEKIERLKRPFFTQFWKEVCLSQIRFCVITGMYVYI